MDARYAGERSTGAVLLFIAALGAFLLLAGCVTRPGDGVRVASQKDAIDMGGQVPAAHQWVDIQAYNHAALAWQEVGQALSEDIGVHVMGFDWYPWSAMVKLPPAYWADAPSGHGKYARLRAVIGAHAFTTLRERDREACLERHLDDDGVTFAERDCASPRRTEIYVYTEEYENGSPSCDPGPGAPRLAFSVDELPACKRRDVATLLKKCIDRDLILQHYDHMFIDHNGVCGPNSLFRGHRRYVQQMEACLSVFGEKWLPGGRLPYWDPALPMPIELRGIAQNPSACPSTSPGCQGWLQIDHAHPDFTTALPPALAPENICENLDSFDLFQSTKLWHASVHNGVAGPGGTFAMFDSPAALIFWPWHKYVDLLYEEWLSCGYPPC